MKAERQAFTLMETVVFTALGSLLLVAIGSMFFFAARSMVALGNYNDLNQKSRTALDIMSRDVRGTSYVISFTTNVLVLRDFDNGVLSFSNNPSSHQLTRTKNGVTDVLLNECDFLNFQVYKKVPSTGFTFYRITNMSEVAEVKLVDVSWKCSRKIFGGKVNTESVQTAKIVIRN